MLKTTNLKRGKKAEFANKVVSVANGYANWDRRLAGGISLQGSFYYITIAKKKTLKRGKQVEFTNQSSERGERLRESGPAARRF